MSISEVMGLKKPQKKTTPDHPPFDPPRMNPIPEWRHNKKDCRRCGKIIDIQDNYCKHCGNRSED